MHAGMEEGLFRGIFIPLFGRSISFPRANRLQALLFGLWRLPWAVKGCLTGQPVGAAARALLINTAFHLVHIQTVDGLDRGMVVRLLVIMVVCLWSLWPLARLGVPQLGGRRWV